MRSAIPILILATAAIARAAPVALDLTRDPGSAREKAESALGSPLLSVTDKGVTAPSGDRHDYVSQAPYWWPDPRHPDGLPYVRKDGRRNPESASPSRTDHGRFQDLVARVGDLAIGYAQTDEGRFADHAARLVRAWFIAPATRMNPNLDHAQSVPGRSGGRSYGIIDFHRITEIIDGVEIIAGSPGWAAADDRAFRDWCREYLGWLRGSKHGRGARDAPNNHGSWYDVQCLRLALFVGADQLAGTIARSVRKNRIALQIAPDGAQPEELARTRSFDYSCFNLHALLLLARMAGRADVDLWSESALHKAFAYLESNLANGWPHEQIDPIDPGALEELQRLFP